MLLEAPAAEAHKPSGRPAPPDASIPEEPVVASDGGPRQRLALAWTVGHHAGLKDRPDTMVLAAVPGAVQLDWARSQDWPPYWHGENYRAYRWMEDAFWTYETRLKLPPARRHERLFFVCGGVDYQFTVSLNGAPFLSQEGMFTPVEIELTGLASDGDILKVTIFPAPKSSAPAQPEKEESIPEDEGKTWFAWNKLSDDNHTQANSSCKPAVSYGWDFHPRLIPLGIWKEAYLEIRPQVHLDQISVGYQLSENLDFVEISLDASLTGSLEEGMSLRWTISDPSGELIFDESGSAAARRHTIRRPALWWPHDHGAQPLYTAGLELVRDGDRILDAKHSRVGFRRVRLVMAPGQWDWPMPFPNINQRSRPPMTFEVNGRQIFAKGANWVSPEIFPGLLKTETYVTQLGLVRQANMNMLRMWGGAPVQKEGFYELCDELGIMVWQDFPLACNCYPDTPTYLKVLDQESRSIIAGLKGHPCVVCWCGGNELFNSWSGMTDQALPLRLLQSNCFQLDPARPFLPTTPLEGVGHGHYVFRDPVTGREAWALFQEANYAAYCEFGCPGPAVLEAIREVIPPDELFPPHPEGSWKAHNAFAAWMKTSHLYPDVIEYYFGPSETLEQLVERGHLLQAEGYRGLYEEVRRQKPVASIALCWCLNEPWPTAANNSLISWPSRPKPALRAVGEACRPLVASARLRKYQWTLGEDFDPELFWLNDSATVGNIGPIQVRVETPQGVSWDLGTWDGADLAANTNLAGPQLHWTLPDLASDRFTLLLETPSVPEASSAYTLLFAI